MIEISAIISTYNRAHFLEGLFESVLAQSIPKDRFEVVIVNNNCTDDTEEKCRRFIANNPDVLVKYCVETQQGLSFGRNRGVAESAGEFVTFLDDDAVIAPDFLEQTIVFFRRKPEVSALGGKILLKYLNGKPAWYNPYLASLLGFFDKGDVEMPFRKDYFRGSNMSFKKSLFEKYDGFNTSLGRVGKQLYGNEEKELFYRFKEQGEEMWYVPSAVVYHLVPIERTYPEFIWKQGVGTGVSQRQHAEVQGTLAVIVAFVKELLKWVATALLALGYLFQGKMAVAKMLFLFRRSVTRGILRNEITK